MSMLNKLTEVVNNYNSLTKLYQEQKAINKDQAALIAQLQNQVDSHASTQSTISSLEETVAALHQKLQVAEEELRVTKETLATYHEIVASATNFSLDSDQESKVIDSQATVQATVQAPVQEPIEPVQEPIEPVQEPVQEVEVSKEMFTMDIPLKPAKKEKKSLWGFNS